MILDSFRDFSLVNTESLLLKNLSICLVDEVEEIVLLSVDNLRMNDGLNLEDSLDAVITHIIILDEFFMSKNISGEQCANLVKNLFFNFSLLPFSGAYGIDVLTRDLNIGLNRKLPRFENVNLVNIVTDVIDYLVVVADDLLKNIIEFNCLCVSPVLLYKFDSKKEIKAFGFLRHLEIIYGILILCLCQN